MIEQRIIKTPYRAIVVGVAVMAAAVRDGLFPGAVLFP